LIAGSCWFALFRDVSRPVRGLPERQGVPPLWGCRFGCRESRVGGPSQPQTL
jgi:hypothetical protein